MSYPQHNGHEYPGSQDMNGQEFVPEISIAQVIGKILKNWYWFALTMAIMLAGAYFFLQTQANVYEVSASLFISTEEPGGRRSPDFMKEIEYFNPNSSLEDEIGVLTSYTLLVNTLDSLQYGLSYFSEDGFRKKELPEQATPFSVEVDSTHPQSVNVLFQVDWKEEGPVKISLDVSQTLLYHPATREDLGIKEDLKFSQWVNWGDTVSSQYFRFVLDKKSGFLPESDTYFFKINTEGELVQAYQSKLAIAPATKDGKIVNMTLQGPTISKDITFLNKLIENYLDQELLEKQAKGNAMLILINTRIDSIRDSLNRVENRLAAFREQNQVVDPLATAKGLQNQVEGIEKREMDTELKLDYYKFLARSLREGNPLTIPSSSSGYEMDPLLRSLLEDLSRYSNEKVELGFKTTHDNPQYKQLEEKIWRIRENIVSNINNHVSSLEIRLRELGSNTNRIQGKLNRLPSYERDLTKIEREYTSVNDMYTYLHEKRAEADIAQANQTVDHKLIDPPHLVSKTPVSPNKILIMGLALFLGLGLPFLIIMGKDLFNSDVSSMRDLQLSTPIPISGFIVQNLSKENTVRWENTKTQFAESFRTLRVRLRYLHKKSAKQVIGITSTWSGEGKSFCSANLACVMGMVGEKTLLIDLDFRKPSQQTYFDTLGEKGLVHYLLDECRREEIIHQSHIRQLDVLPAGKSHFNPLDLLEQDKFHELLVELTKKYDKIIVDTPPIGRTSDYLMFRSWIDHTLYVVRHNFTKTHALQDINEMYERGEMKEISIVVNAVKNTQKFQYGDTGLSGSPQTEDVYGKMYAKK